jgi:hypothetical protein
MNALYKVHRLYNAHYFKVDRDAKVGPTLPYSMLNTLSSSENDL